MSIPDWLDQPDIAGLTNTVLLLSIEGRIYFALSITIRLRNSFLYLKVTCYLTQKSVCLSHLTRPSGAFLRVVNPMPWSQLTVRFWSWFYGATPIDQDNAAARSDNTLTCKLVVTNSSRLFGRPTMRTFIASISILSHVTSGKWYATSQSTVSRSKPHLAIDLVTMVSNLRWHDYTSLKANRIIRSTPVRVKTVISVATPCGLPRRLRLLAQNTYPLTFP